MGRKVGIDLGDVIGAAATLADREGLEALTLTAVAGELGIKTPSLYNHVDGLAGLRRLLTLHAADVFAGVVSEALEGLDGAEALMAVAVADRRFAREHPGLYASFLPAPTPGEDDELYHAMAAPVFQIAHVLLDMGVPQSDAFHLIRGFRALLHGFLDLEARGGFGLPTDIDESFATSMDLMIAAISANVAAPDDERQP